MCNLLALLIVMAPPVIPKQTDGSYDVMRLLLSHADLVILGEIELVGNAIGHEAGSRFTWTCSVRVHDVLKGELPNASPIRAGIHIVAGHPFTPKKGDQWVLFLQNMGSGDNVSYITSDIRFGVQPVAIAADLKRVANEMNRKHAVLPK